MNDGAAFHSTSSTPGPEPLPAGRPRVRWTKTLYAAAVADPVLPTVTKLVAQQLAWRADALRLDELHVSRELLADLLRRILGRKKPVTLGEAQRHLLALEGKPSGFRGATAWLPHPVYLSRVPQAGKPGGRTRNQRGELVAKANTYRLGMASLPGTPGESVDNSVVVAARAWRQPTPRESPYPQGVSLRSTPLGVPRKEAVPADLEGGGLRPGGASGPVAGPPGDHGAPRSGDGLPAAADHPGGDAPDDRSTRREIDGAVIDACRRAVQDGVATWQQREEAKRAALDQVVDAARGRRHAEHRAQWPRGCPTEWCGTCYPEGVVW